jgi:beta-N-acetylglucosaminidase
VNPYLHLVSLHKNLAATPVAYNFSYPMASMWLAATDEQIEFYLNPYNFINDPYGKYQFLVLNYTSGITAEDLNTILKGKGVLDGKGAVFLQAAADNNVSPIYLVSHALLETGNGSTALAKGIFVTQVDGKSVSPNLVYNMFGIGAYDINADKFGSEYAYKQGWFSVDAAITGGAKWISSQYINNKYYNQNTLYKMRWNPANPGTHQYSTDVAWAYNQTYNIKRLAEKLPNANLVFDIPK